MLGIHRSKRSRFLLSVALRTRYSARERDRVIGHARKAREKEEEKIYAISYAFTVVRSIYNSKV